MTQDPSIDQPDEARPEQHGPEMDDTQVQATGDLRDDLPPVQPESDDEELED